MAKLKENSTILKSTGEEIIATEESVDEKLLLKADKDYVDTQLNTKVDKVSGKQLSTEDYTTAEKTKLANIEAGANNYTHPSTHPASMITESTSRRFVSDVEKSMWNSKAEISDIPTKVSQLDNDVGYVTQDELGDVGYGDMMKATYDKDNDGIVDKAESVPWSGVTGKPSTFPPSSHNHDELYEPKNSNIQAHISNKSNPHSVTKSHVGLSSVQNYGIATQAIAEAGTSNSYYMTPLRVRQSIEKNAITYISNLETDFKNHETATDVHGLRDDVVIIGKDADAVVGYGMANVAVGVSAYAFAASTAIGAGANAENTSAQAIGTGAQALNNAEGVLGIESISWKVPGSFTVSGTKNFEIPHPKPEKSATHVIRHGAVESPTPGDTLYRWKIQATKDNDLVTIDLPDYFIWLNKDVQIWVTGQGHFGNGYGVLNRETEQLEIHCQLAGEYNVLVIGTRNDDNVQDWYIKGVEREVGESWLGETYTFKVDEILEVEEIKEV